MSYFQQTSGALSGEGAGSPHLTRWPALFQSYHCFCQQDTGGNWFCCKCGLRNPNISTVMARQPHAAGGAYRVYDIRWR